MIVNRQRRIPVDVEPLAEFCRRVREELRFPEDGVTVRLVSDSAIARLNRIFRGKDGPTDVLSFPSATRRAQPRRGRVHQRRGEWRAEFIAPERGDFASLRGRYRHFARNRAAQCAARSRAAFRWRCAY